MCMPLTAEAADPLPRAQPEEVGMSSERLALIGVSPQLPKHPPVGVLIAKGIERIADMVEGQSELVDEEARSVVIGVQRGSRKVTSGEFDGKYPGQRMGAFLAPGKAAAIAIRNTPVGPDGAHQMSSTPIPDE